MTVHKTDRWILLLVVVMVVTASRAEAEKPIGVERLEAYIEAYDSSDPEVFHRFAAEHFLPPEPGGRSQEERVATLMRIARMTGGYVLHRVEETTDEKVVALVRKKLDGGWARLVLELNAAPPHLIASVGLMIASPPDDLDLEPLSEANLVRELEAHLAELVADDRFSGTVLVARGERVIFQKAYGKADLRFDADNDLDTRFNLGSATKMFTGVAIAQLAERGKLSFEDTVGDHLRDYPNREVAEKVTLHHLLTHTSGLGSYWEPLFATNWTEIRTHDQLLALFAEAPLDFPPGERFQYSNSGFAVLGKVIEAVSGMSYFDFVRKNVFEPAGMISTDSYEVDQLVPNLATGYTRGHEHDFGAGDEGPLRSNVFAHPAKGCAAGGGYSTVGDLHRFAQALANETLLKPETLEILLGGKVEMAPGIDYAYGFGSRGKGKGHNVGHNGGAPGISADFKTYPETGYTVAVLSNYDSAAMLVSRRLETLLARLAKTPAADAP